MSGRTFGNRARILFALLAVGLLIAVAYSLGSSQTMTKCVVLSVIAHVWLLLYASGSRVALPQGDPKGSMSPVRFRWMQPVWNLPAQRLR